MKYQIRLLNKPLLLILLHASYISFFGQSVNYVESTEVISNPERGLQKYSITSSDYATTPNYNNLSLTTLNNWKTSDDKVTVVYRYFLLDAFLNSDINSTFLNNIQTDFDHVRTAGLKIIVRFSYSNAQGASAQQPTKSQILAHIAQLSSILTNNKDVILSIQAGFIGTWGEWYYTNSNEFGTDGNISETQWNNRKEIIDAMLLAAPIEIPIQVRYAGIKTKMYGNSQLNEQTGYQNTSNARIGFYNDAFLNDYGDQGTYSVSSQCESPVGTTEYEYISNETKYLPMTGETNGLNSCNNGFRTTSTNAINELNLTNWTTINRDYYTPFWDQIISSGDYDEILKNIGYRFVLNSSTITVNDGNFDLTLEVSNKGYARPFKKRNVHLILKNTITNEVTTSLINTDIRTWESSITLNQNFDLELSGTFQLYLWMPDDATSLQSNSDYCIQFANLNTWEAETGYNNLLQTVTLDKTLSTNSDSKKTNFSISPNPASDFIVVHLPDINEARVQILNPTGEVIKEALVSANENLNVSDLKSGIYFIRLNNNPLSVTKFIKE